MSKQPLRQPQPKMPTLPATAAALGIFGVAAVVGLVPLAHAQITQASPAPAAFKAGPPSGDSNSLRIIPAWPASSDKGKACGICGIVESIGMFRNEGAADTPGDDGIADDIVGKQLKKNRGNILLTIISLSGRPYAGHVLDWDAGKGMEPSISYVVKVHMVDGSFRLVTQIAKPEYTVGDRVRVTSGAVITT